ncbi:carbon catabolite repressor protein 4 homolog 6 isoform X2 [Rhodamnia argentea]|uniref:Carbon catabolite repressor protein 4 homolog 6 isoform X2 n=1 Tax=Rhodamnia argentea TaxID=178133 RepID=A0A8B8Q7I8_9MYRT|nr:carbon catabolite repressor protein 4 homolog 6 isoform X2 [Rhodamnia argentea]
MRRRCSSLPSSLAASASTSASAGPAMYPRPKYRGGRYSSQRSISDSLHDGGRGQFSSGDSNVHAVHDRNRGFQQGARVNFVTGDSHFRSVQDANRGLRRGEMGDSAVRAGYRPPPFNSRRHFVQSQSYGPSSGYNHDTQFHHPQHCTRGQSIQQSPQSSRNRQYQQHRPSKQNQPFWRPPQSDWSLAARTSEEQRSRPQRPPDYRIWEYAKTEPPSDCERFVILSYNILADYLAINHRSKLYYHIPRYMLDWQWRKRSILFELGLWSADIMCFQEVDKFYDLEEELKSRGYCGIWKMRTGNPVDGCAIFWRASRFKLLQEECIEFNKLGLRDNVAQICVLELVSENETGNTTHQSASSAGSRKIVVCNIHVLYNPKRGEIKLGQIRVLLDRAYVVSRAWADAPVVLCGDFNCTPKSPLYNFISEQKLSLSGLDRDKVSGQASAEIRPTIPDSQNTRGQPQFRVDNNKLKDSTMDEQNQRIQDNSKENSLNVDDPFQHRCTDSDPASSAKSCTTRQSASDGSELDHELRKDSEQNPADDAANKNGLPPDTFLDGEPSSNTLIGGTVSPLDDVKSGKDKCTYQMASSCVTELSDLNSSQAKDCVDVVLTASIMGEDYTSRVTVDPESLDSSDAKIASFVLSCQKATSDDAETTSSEVAGQVISQSVNDKQDNPSTLHSELLVDTMGDSIDEELKKLSLNEPEESGMEVGCSYEDDDTFLSALHNLGGADSSPGSQIVKEFSSGLDFEPVEGEISTYDSSLWTPMEIATATGSADCLFLEHPLKLKSTYPEVEDSSGTRDTNGEPMVTSYNRCFMGTVDYIWHSDGLQTTRVLAPIPKQAMQWTTGFPTKRWGSDHIALVSELALTKGAADQRNEVQ